MMFCGALFIMFLGYFQGDKRLMVAGAGLVAALIAFPELNMLNWVSLIGGGSVDD